MYIYGKKIKLQWLIKPALLNQIPSNLLNRGFLWILTAKKNLVKIAFPEPPNFDMLKNIHFYDIVSWQPHFTPLWKGFSGNKNLPRRDLFCLKEHISVIKKSRILEILNDSFLRKMAFNFSKFHSLFITKF